MAKNKQHCLKCGMELDDYRMVLMIGPLGYRRYAVCLRCAGKAGAGAPKIGGGCGPAWLMRGQHTTWNPARHPQAAPGGGPRAIPVSAS